MKFQSYMKDQWSYCPVRVEVATMPGLPQVQITGLPDQMIKESVSRLRSAFRASGYQWPKRQQIYINLEPTDRKKSGAGVELAIAAAILHHTGQMDLSAREGQILYGSVSLSGEVGAPSDLRSLCHHLGSEEIVTGVVVDDLPRPLLQVRRLEDLVHCVPSRSRPIAEQRHRPPLPTIKLNSSAAELLVIAAIGEHSLLLAGPAGSGKSLFAECLRYVLPNPSDEIFKSSLKVAEWFGESLSWRPFVAPHHTTPVRSMVGGGGATIFPGELSHAHGGILLLDEYLEFRQEVQEALREPMEKGAICVARLGQSQQLPARFQLVATTNLCPCGKWVPKYEGGCSFGLLRCQSVLRRLSGPMLDRFDLLEFTQDWSASRDVSLQEVLERVEKATDFRSKRGQSEVNGRLQLEELRSQMDPFVYENLLPQGLSSLRRRRGLLRVARSFADLEESPMIETTHLNQADRWSWRSFQQLSDL